MANERFAESRKCFGGSSHQIHHGKLEQGLASAFIQSAPSRSSFEGSDSTSATTFIHTAAMAASHASVPHQESQPGLLRMKRILKRNFLVGLHTPASLG